MRCNECEMNSILTSRSFFVPLQRHSHAFWRLFNNENGVSHAFPFALAPAPNSLLPQSCAGDDPTHRSGRVGSENLQEQTGRVGS